jgi:excisionase family DNA binding protein
MCLSSAASQEVNPSRLCKSGLNLPNLSPIIDLATMSTVAPRPLGLSTSQAARELGVSLGTIRRWSDLGYLHAYRTPGGQRRFSREQIDEFVRSLEEGRRPNAA